MIVLVTRNQSFLVSVAQRLSEMGKRNIGISSVDELWPMVRLGRPNIIILDWHASHEDPSWILRKLYAEGYKGKVIIMAGESEQNFVREVAQLGAIQIVGRPLSVNRVICAIKIAQEHLHVEKYATSSSANEPEFMGGRVYNHF